MNNVKVFPSFEAPPNITDDDRNFLTELQKIKTANDALYVNFSGLNYRCENPDTVHFLTYPIDWITQYIKNNYSVIDPLLRLDYRRVSYIDWMDLQNEPDVRDMMGSFNEHGLGSHGLTVVVNMGNSLHGALGMTFDIPDNSWFDFKTAHMDVFRFQADKICERYAEIYLGKPRRNYHITPRETECLFWVAMGKTDDQIAETLKIGKWTVVSHLKSAKFKLGSPNRAAAVAVAITSGIIELKQAG